MAFVHVAEHNYSPPVRDSSDVRATFSWVSKGKLSPRLLLVCSDILAIALACTTVAVTPTFLTRPVSAGDQAGRLLIDMETTFVVGVLLAGFAVCRNVYLGRPLSPNALKTLVLIYGCLLIPVLTVVRLQAGRSLSAGLVAGFVALPAFMVLLRAVLEWTLAHTTMWQQRVIVVGDASGLGWANGVLAGDAGKRFTCVAAVDLSRVASPRDLSWEAMTRKLRAERLLVILTGREELDHTVLEAVMRSCLPFTVVRTGVELPVGGSATSDVLSAGAVATDHHSRVTKPLARIAKAAFDVTFASLAILFLAPLLAVIAIAVKADGGPALFLHERVGSDGRRFRCLKFRSMVRNPQDILQRTLETDPEARREWQERQKLTHDPRVTAIGKFLRATSLDELPQLFNILRLEMSVVGPRPIVENEIPRYGDDIQYYYKVRPGLTGLWQVSGRSDTTYQQRIRFDRAYVKNWSLSEDLMIILRTLPAVLRQQGAR